MAGLAVVARGGPQGLAVPRGQIKGAVDLSEKARRSAGGGWELIVAPPLTVVNELPLPLSLALSGSAAPP